MFNLVMQYNPRLYRAAYKHVISKCTNREEEQIKNAPKSTNKRHGTMILTKFKYRLHYFTSITTTTTAFQQ